MQLYIYHDFGKIGITPDCVGGSVYQYPAEFLMAMCHGETACYSGTLRALTLFLDNPRIHDILLTSKLSSNGAALRLEYLRVFITSLENM